MAVDEAQAPPDLEVMATGDLLGESPQWLPAEGRLARSEELARTGFVSKQALDDDRATAESARATVAASMSTPTASRAVAARIALP